MTGPAHLDCSVIKDAESPISEDQSVEDINVEAYLKYKSVNKWFKDNIGYYIAIVDGKLVEKDRDRSKLLEYVRSNFSEKEVFFTLVAEHKKAVVLSSPIQIKKL